MQIKAYKGFNKDMTCRGFQFKEGESYEEPKAKLCECGFHACLNPLDCLSYYNITNSTFHEVELDDVSDERVDDTKVCAKKIKSGIIPKPQSREVRPFQESLKLWQNNGGKT